MLLDFWWPYLVIFGTMVLTAFLMPEEPAIIAWGITASNWKPPLKWYLALPACMAGIAFTDCLLYGIGRFWNKRILASKWFNKHVSPERRQKIEDGFHRSGFMILLTARLLPVPGLRTGVFVSAGLIRFPFVKFLIYDALSLALAGGVFFLGAYFFVDAIKDILSGFHGVQTYLLLIGVPLVGLYILYRYLRYVKRHKGKEDDLELGDLIGLPHRHHDEEEPAAVSEAPADAAAADNGRPVTSNRADDVKSTIKPK